MNREDIIKLARETGVEWLMHNQFYKDHLQHFAALVAAAEREHMIKDGWRQCAKGQRTTQFCGQLEQALIAEREACAELVQSNAESCDTYSTARAILESNAAAIRARKENT